jgi:Rod binding domain-containing protein
MQATQMNLISATPDPLRERVDQFLGLFFYGTMLKQARESRLTDTEIGFGGRGEQAFAAQLDQILAERAGTAAGNSLGDAIYDQLSRKK